MSIEKLQNVYNDFGEISGKINEIIDNGGGGGGGSDAVWGRIQGNIVAQTDLMAVFNEKANKTDVYTKAQANTLLDAKANASDVYTKTQADTLLDAKQGTLTAGAGITITNDTIAVAIINDTIASRTTVWSSQEVKDRFDAISGSARIVVIASLPASPEENTLYYVGSASPYHIWLQSAGVLYDMGTTEIDLSGYYNKTEVDTLLNAKANASSVYTKTETDTLINAKQDTITDSVITSITDSDYLSDLDATNKTNKRITLANIFAWLLTKLTTTISSISTNNQIPTAKAVYDLIKTTTPTYTGNISNPRITYLNDKTIMLNCSLRIPDADISWSAWGSIFYQQLNNYATLTLPANVSHVISLNATNNRLTGTVAMAYSLTDNVLSLSPFLTRGTNNVFEFNISVSIIAELS